MILQVAKNQESKLKYQARQEKEAPKIHVQSNMENSGNFDAPKPKLCHYDKGNPSNPPLPRQNTTTLKKTSRHDSLHAFCQDHLKNHPFQ